MNEVSIQDVYMQRCIDLASLGFKGVKSNPMVGALLVSGDKIIGEGYHEYFGGPHAEVNAFNSVSDDNRHLIPGSTLYVTLEPCSHTGKTPPCAHRIVREKVTRVIIGCIDPNPVVAGRGIQYLVDHGVSVTTAVMESQCKALISKFKANLIGLPYVHLKWAQSADGFIGSSHPVWLTNPLSGVLTHTYRSKYDAILVGKNTILVDDPQLTTRHIEGPNPLRIVMDTNAIVPHTAKVLSDQFPTLVINQVKDEEYGTVTYLKVSDMNDIESILRILYAKGITSIIVEGGSQVLHSFINGGFWNEAMVVKTQKVLGQGVKAPVLSGNLIQKYALLEDEIIVMSSSNP
jgi:diaminohydroxyphosphoribosylaminopyrimidine deaminase / 5-amino-6-(5-phosphoribosylamino)uracil reductase